MDPLWPVSLFKRAASIAASAAAASIGVTASESGVGLARCAFFVRLTSSFLGNPSSDRIIAVPISAHGLFALSGSRTDLTRLIDWLEHPLSSMVATFGRTLERRLLKANCRKFACYAAATPVEGKQHYPLDVTPYNIPLLAIVD